MEVLGNMENLLKLVKANHTKANHTSKNLGQRESKDLDHKEVHKEVHQEKGVIDHKLSKVQEEEEIQGLMKSVMNQDPTKLMKNQRNNLKYHQ